MLTGSGLSVGHSASSQRTGDSRPAPPARAAAWRRGVSPPGGAEGHRAERCRPWSPAARSSPRRRTRLRRRAARGRPACRGSAVAGADLAGVGASSVRLLRVGGGVGLDLHRIGDLAVVQPSRTPRPRRSRMATSTAAQAPTGPAPPPCPAPAATSTGAARPRARDRLPAASCRPPGLSQDSRQSSRAARLLGDGTPHTPSWQVAALPSVPQYCRSTPTEWSPSLGTRCHPPPTPSAEATHQPLGQAAASRRQSHGDTARSDAAPGSRPPQAGPHRLYRLGRPSGVSPPSQHTPPAR